VARFLYPAFAVLIVSAIARPAWAQDGPAGTPDPPRASSAAAPSATLPPAVPLKEAMRLDEYLNRLDDWRNQGRITAAESARARRLLNAAVVAGDPTVRVPLDASGRIDLLALARGQSVSSSEFTRPGDRLASRVLNEFDIRMRVSARDMATPGNLTMFASAPGYAAAPMRDLGRIVKDALEHTPVGELPGGRQLLSIAGAFPHASGAKANQTVKELGNLLADGQTDWLRARVGPLVERHKIEAGIAAFAAITGIRLASPGTARFMDGLGVRLRIMRVSTSDARLYTTGRLVYRNAYVFPELELESGVRHVAGSTTLRATTAAVFGAEAIEHARGRAGMGARWEHGRVFVDTNATFAFPENLARTELRTGYLTEAGFVLSTAVAATFGDGSGAVGGAPGRVGFELDLAKVVVVGGKRGEASLFACSGADSDFNHVAWRAGMVFRMPF